MDFDFFLSEYSGDQFEVIHFLYELLSEEFQLTTKFRYGIPFFYRKSWICYINPKKNGITEFAFTRGNELFDEAGLIDSKGRKQVKSIEFDKLSDIPLEKLKLLINEALVLDETISYKSKRKRGE